MYIAVIIINFIMQFSPHFECSGHNIVTMCTFKGLVKINLIK
jgi:hypothetical protein